MAHIKALDSKGKSIEPSRRAIGIGLAASILPLPILGACGSNIAAKNSPFQNVSPKVIVPIANSATRDDLMDAYNCFIGVPLARFSDITLPSPDGFAISVRVAVPAVITGRIPILVCSPDIGDDALNYDILSGGLASRGYAVLTLSASGTANDRGEGAAIRRITRRAQQISYVLDNLPKVLSILGREAQMIETSKIGALGYSEAAWTALGLVGWGRNLVPSSSVADARIIASFALVPSQIPYNQRLQSRSTSRVIYGRTMIAADIDNMPALPSGSGIIGVNLPPVAPGFGGLLGLKQAPRRSRAQRPQRENLASACAAAGLFFDWSLKGDKSKIETLMAANGRVLGDMPQPFSIVRA